MSFFRVSDNRYLSQITNSDLNQTVELDIKFKKCKPEQRRLIVNALFSGAISQKEQNQLCSEFKEIYFSQNGKNYVLVPRRNFALRLFAALFRSLKIISNESKLEYKIVESKIPSFFYQPKISLTVADPKPLRIEASQPNSFAKLATALFQDYERFHSWKDILEHPYRDASDYQLVLQGNELVAKPLSDSSVTTQDKQNTLRAYRDFLYEEYGTTVINRIQTHYEFNLDDMIKKGFGLTPEIVYRCNIGTTHVEIDDVAALARDLQEGKKLPRRIAERTQDLVGKNLDVKNPEHFALLLERLLPTKEEADVLFTGRKLHGKISSWYTQGDDTLFKPWVDQQELLQTCQKIPQRDWDCFYEDLAMILCKKHLHQKNPDQTYRVGGLIPAPKVEGKPQEYYTVTSWIHNSRGIYSYTLEPACPSSELPVIKLYRSTSVSRYNLDGASSYKNDFNPLNPPGYEGAYLLEPYEKEFFDSRTIPVWVGYQMTGKLDRANEAIISEIESKYTRPTLKQFIRKHDSDFMELIEKCREEKMFGGYHAWYLLYNCLRNSVKHKYAPESKYVVALKNFLDEAALNPKTQKQAEKLLEWWKWEQKEPATEERALIATLNKLEKENDRAAWSDFLANYAKEQGEDVASKTAQDINFVGHSLGAACAQHFLVAYTAAKGRMPLPGHTISARIFDDPAINKEDNKAFVKFGNRHAKLFEQLHAGFEIVRRQETTDFVPQSGEIHLGAAKSGKEQKRMLKWLRFDAAIQKPSSKAKDPQIRDYTTSHGRMFAGANSTYGWLKTWLKRQKTAELQELNKTLPHADYKVTHYDPQTQWYFDKPPNTRTWKILRDLWDLPFGFTPLYAERIRTYLSAFFRSGAFKSLLPEVIGRLGQANLPDDTAHGNWKSQCDENGVFVVKKQ